MQDDNSTIQRLYDEDGLLDILLGVEQYFDGMDLYAYKNWISGEIVEGPVVSKYWVEVTLKYTNENFPDPRGALIFERQGTKIEIMKTFEKHPIEHPRSQEDMGSVLGASGSVMSKPKEERIPILLIKFQIPRKLVNPESFNEYKLISSEFNNNSLLNDEPVEEEEQQAVETEEGSDLDFDELGDENV